MRWDHNCRRQCRRGRVRIPNTNSVFNLIDPVEPQGIVGPDHFDL